MFLEVEEGGQDRDEEAVKVYLIRFIAENNFTTISFHDHMTVAPSPLICTPTTSINFFFGASQFQKYGF